MLKHNRLRSHRKYLALETMVYSSPDKCKPVSVNSIDGGAVVIQGAYLRAEEAWVPSDAYVQDGMTFIKVAKCNRGLQRFCNKVMTRNAGL